MPRMRRNNRVFTSAVTIAATAVLAVPAFAAAPGAIETRTALTKITKWAGKVKLREPGPFVPIVGKLDIGSAEAAFGAARSGHVHAGQDLFAPAGTPLIAVDDAVVLDAGSDGGQGNYVHLYDRRRERTYVYMHMVEPTTLDLGDSVEAGDRVGSVGCTGSCSGDHLHFEVREGRGFTAEAIDPLPLIRGWSSVEKAR